jgi:hypothetical protein
MIENPSCQQNGSGRHPLQGITKLRFSEHDEALLLIKLIVGSGGHFSCLRRENLGGKLVRKSEAMARSEMKNIELQPQIIADELYAARTDRGSCDLV